jgi:arylsulfatase A-like enzyme
LAFISSKKTPEEGYHFMDDMTEKALKWISQQKALTPDKPFFVYFAPAPRTRPTTCRRSGRTTTRASSTPFGTSCASVARLKELKSLLNQGLITQSQYQEESQRILNQLAE